MAKVYYKIDSRKKAKITEDSKGKIIIRIDDIVNLEENGVTKLEHGEFINTSENPKIKYKFNECFTLFLYYFVAILLVILLALLGIGKDFNILTSSYIDNIIGIAALLFGLISIPKVKTFLYKKFPGPRIGNKLWYVVIMLCLPYYIILFMSWAGVPISFSNICGIIGFIICILTW